MPRRHTFFHRLSGSRALAPVTETAKTFGKIAGCLLLEPLRDFRTEYKSEIETHGDIAKAAGKAYYKAALESSEPVMHILAGVSGMSGAIGLAVVAVNTYGVVAGVAAGIAAAPLLFFAAPLVFLAVGTAACTVAAAIWAPPVGVIKGLSRWISRTPEERRLRAERRAVQALEKSTRFEVRKLPYNESAMPPAPSRGEVGKPDAPTP